MDNLPINSSFDIKDHVDASTDAGRRSRTVTIVLVVASVLVAIGYYNSLNWSWPHHRLIQAFDYSEKDTDRIKKLLGIRLNSEETGPDSDPGTRARKEQAQIIDDYRKNREQATIRAYVENVHLVRVPFFGIAFDVNDLGIVGGIGLIIVLLMMRYSVSREIKNLNVSFREALCHDQLSQFYHELAMRQVFTVPHMRGEKRNRFLALGPKFIYILPATIFTLGVLYDYDSVLHLEQYHWTDVFIQLLVEAGLLLVIWVLSFKCWQRQSQINIVWDAYWNRIEDQKSSVIRLDKSLVEEFGSDDAVNSALRSLRLKSPQRSTGA